MEEPEIQAVVVEEQQTDSDEWEQIAEATPAPMFAVPSPEELKWSHEISVIREVFPDAEVSRTVQLLEAANGNVQVVLNSLFEIM